MKNLKLTSGAPQTGDPKQKKGDKVDAIKNPGEATAETSNNLGALTVAGIARKVHTRQLSATQVATETLEKLAENPFNAVEVVTSEKALKQAAYLDQLSDAELQKLPLAGVPLGIKAECAIKGIPTTYGGKAQQQPAPEDSEIVRKLEAAGALIVCTTRMPEFGQYPYTESPHWGHVENPVAKGKTTGGSSGGTAALVAGNILPAGVGGDGGGSIRIPAAACGLIGLKAVRGRVSVAPEPDLWGDLGVLGVLTRTVEDTALLYDVISGTTSKDRHHAPKPPQSFLTTYAGTKLDQKLRIGFITKPASPLAKVDVEVLKMMEQMQATLIEAGHQVEDAGRWPDATLAFLPQFFGALAEEKNRVDTPTKLEKRTRQSAKIGEKISEKRIQKARAQARKMQQALAEKYAEYDLLISPTLACLPPNAPVLKNCNALTGLLRAMPMAVFTGLANVTGTPAISLPAGTTSNGTPVGIQASVFTPDETKLIEFARLWELLAAQTR